MCTYLTMNAEVAGSAMRSDGDWFELREAVVMFDHPVDAPVDHALCIDFRSTTADTDPSARVAVELDAASARRLAESILAALNSEEAVILQ